MKYKAKYLPIIIPAICAAALFAIYCTDIPFDNAIDPKFSYTLTATAETGGSVTRTPSQPSYAGGTEVVVTATPDDDHVFDGWLGDSPSNIPTVTIIMDGDKTLTATFREKEYPDEPVRYILETNVEPANSGNDVSRVPNQTEYDANTQITVIATHAEGYTFTGWTGAPETVNPYDRSITFNINDHMRLTANFEPVPPPPPTLTTNANPMTGGTVTPSGTTTLNAGTSVTVTAVEATDHEFIGWFGAPESVNSSSKTITFNINEDITLIANFRRIPPDGSQPPQPPIYNLATNISPADGGTVTRAPNQSTFNAETEVTLTARPNAGFEFTGWTGSLTSASQTFSFKILGDMNMTANFKPVNMLTTNATVGGSVIRVPDKATYDNGELVEVTAIPRSGYEFVNWTGTGAPSPATTNPAIITMNGDRTLTANFRPVYELTLNRVPTIGGTVTRNPNLVIYSEGTRVEVTATAANGYRFTRWSGASTSTDSIVTITMDAHKALTANFVLKDYTLITPTTPTIGGSVSRVPNQTSYNHGTNVTVTATAAAGYRFTGWSGASESTNPTVTITMDENKTLTANFVQTPTLTVTRNPTNGGTVTVNGTTTTGITTHDHGTRVTVSATAASGYRFTEWSGASTSTSSQVTITMNRDTTLTANFQRVHTLTANREPAGGTVTVNGTTTTGTTTHDEGAVVRVCAIANRYYAFIRWSGSSSSTDSCVSITMNSAQNLTANFFGGAIPSKAHFNPDVAYSSFVDTRDRQTYFTVLMPDGREWMAENLNYNIADGTGSWCYDNNPANCAKYGRLYNWTTAMGIDTSYNNTLWGGSDVNHRGVCPVGWHLPSNDEWDALENAIPDDAGTKLRSAVGWVYHIPTATGTNDYGFSALPGGVCAPHGCFNIEGNYGNYVSWFSATENDASTALYRGIGYNSEYTLYRSNYYKSTTTRSVRCLRD